METTGVDGQIANTFSGLDSDSRALGYLAWQLVGDWPRWVRRRVESISFETSNSIRRRVSVDLRLVPELFDKGIITWGAHRIQYVPIAMLRKRRLVHFDLEDESGGALPLITKQRNCAITASMLSAGAQSLANDYWRKAHPHPDQDIGGPARIVLPKYLEDTFWKLAYLNPRGPESVPSALSVYREFAPAHPDAVKPIADWQWTETANGMEADACPDDWYALLGRDQNFERLVYDIAQLFMVCVPLAYEPGRRRIVKFSYTEYLSEAAGPSDLVKGMATKLKLARGWNWAEDRLEGLPRDPHPRPEDWVPELDEVGADRMKVIPKLLEIIGWRAQVAKVDAPAVSHGSSYHISISTPNGIQIRRAELALTGSKEGRPDPRPQRGNRTLRAVDLHVGSPEPTQSGQTFLYIRAQTSLIVRAGFCCAALTAAALTLLWWFSPRITAENGAHAGEAVAAALTIIPGLLSILATRDAEHPWATSMVFGMRVLVMTPGVIAVIAAGQLVVGNAHSWFGIVLFGLTWLIAAVLLVGWRLAGRGQPDPSIV